MDNSKSSGVADSVFIVCPQGDVEVLPASGKCIYPVRHSKSLMGSQVALVTHC